MRTYILISFWMSVIGVLIRSFHIMKDEYPRTTSIEAGVDYLANIISGCFMVWAAYLLWA